MNVIIDGNAAILTGGNALVTFAKPTYVAFGGANSGGSLKETIPAMARLITKLNVAPWGEDNRFPQNVTAQLEYSGVTKSALDFKAKALFGNGIVWGKVTSVDEKGNEIFTPVQKGEHPELEEFMRVNGKLHRFYLEFNQDWAHFVNCFPEFVLSKDGKKIKRLIHQESCDCRFVQMDDDNRIKWVLLSKLWGQLSDQFVKFDPKKATGTGAVTGQTNAPQTIDNKYVKQLRALDPYNAVEDLKAAVEEGHRNVILPVQYPSPNKTYYQLAVWDGARKAGWVEIDAKIPAMLKVVYETAFSLKYHIRIPENYMERRYGAEQWSAFKPAERDEKRKEVLQLMNTFLAGTDNAQKTFVSYFEVGHDGKAIPGIEIIVVDNKSTIDKDLLASSAAISVILFAMQMKPSMIGASAPGATGGRDGSGSDTREAYLVYCAQLYLERQMILEPLLLVRDFNGWDEDLEPRFRDIVLTTLDKNSGTEKKLS